MSLLSPIWRWRERRWLKRLIQQEAERFNWQANANHVARQMEKRGERYSAEAIERGVDERFALL
jgi:hypothetical protein